ncbi:MAG: NUDIX hydrolase [bacterium]|nr:NUDIX hydrolase [bacterium]
MTKICDHTSVGMLVWKDEKLLLIERAKFPFGFAIPAGHVDDDSTYEKSAQRELQEEVGLETAELKLIAEGRRENPCRREDGSWHYWKIYQVSTIGNIDRSKEETKQAGWYTKDQIKELGNKTEKYNNKDISEEEWAKSPGLEPVMYEWFKELKII